LLLLSIIAAALADPMTVNVRLVQDVKVVDLATQDVLVGFSLTNPHAYEISVFTWYTPLEGVFGDLFTVTNSNGKVLPYVGKIARRYTGNMNANFVSVPAGGQINVVVSLADSYEWTQGKYSIQLNPAPVSEMLTYNIEGSPVALQMMGELPVVVPSVSCTSQQLSQINSANGNARNQASRGRANLNSQDTGLQRTWFGTFNDGRWNSLRTCFTNIQGNLQRNNYNCNGPQCSSNTYAYVFPGDSTFTIYLCNMFWQIPGERAETLVHEASHFNPVCRTNDFTYGRQNCMNLARTNPANAARNADNVCYFGADA